MFHRRLCAFDVSAGRRHFSLPFCVQRESTAAACEEAPWSSATLSQDPPIFTRSEMNVAHWPGFSYKNCSSSQQHSFNSPASCLAHVCNGSFSGTQLTAVPSVNPQVSDSLTHSGVILTDLRLNHSPVDGPPGEFKSLI